MQTSPLYAIYPQWSSPLKQETHICLGGRISFLFSTYVAHFQDILGKNIFFLIKMFFRINSDTGSMTFKQEIH